MASSAVSLPSILRTFIEYRTLGHISAANIRAICDCLRDTCNKGQRVHFRKKYNKLRRSLHPLATDEDVSAAQAVLDDVTTDAGKREARAALAAAIRVAGESAAAHQHAETFGVFDREFADIWAIDNGAGNSNRARRAVKASDVFSKHAGLTKIPGARLDHHGNAIGDTGDLVRDGAFRGQKIVILQAYNGREWGENFDIAETAVKSLLAKGFTVKHYTEQVDHYGKYALISATTLDRELQDVNQFWLISAHIQKLSDAHIEVIMRHWKSGMGMYIFGDNKPFFVDANRVLKKMIGIEMSGNVPGGKTVGPCDITDTKARGFPACHATTGITTLHEGVTLAHFEKGEVMRAGFQELLRDHDGNLITIYRPAQNGCGALIASGGFTQLYPSNWDGAGSARFVKNCAALLAVRFKDSTDEEEKKAPVELDWTDAPKFECDITYEEKPCAVMVTNLGNPDKFTDDFSINESLGMGSKTHKLFAQQVYTWDCAKTLRDAGTDPFRRMPVKALIPIVCLNKGHNRKIVGQALCQVFTGGRAMYQTAWFLFYSACHWQYTHEPDHPEVWKFFMEQIEANCRSTPTFTEVGDPIHLISAMEQFMSLSYTDRMVKTFGTITVMAHALKRTGRMSDADLTKVLKQEAIRVVLSSFMRSIKQASTKKFKMFVDKHAFSTYHGITRMGTAKLMSLDMFPEEGFSSGFIRDLTLMSTTIGEVLTKAELTVIIEWAYHQTYQFWCTVKESSLLAALDANTGLPKAVWKGDGCTDAAAKEMLEKRFAHYFDHDIHSPMVPFKTCHGPSVFRMVTGEWFVNRRPGSYSPETLKPLRIAAFQDEFKTSDDNGYPDDNSVHYSLHRSVIRAMISDTHKTKTMRDTAMCKAVAAFLIKDGRGNFHVPNIKDRIHHAIDSYLECRKAGMKEPVTDMVTLEQKIELEVEMARAEWDEYIATRDVATADATPAHVGAGSQ